MHIFPITEKKFLTVRSWGNLFLWFLKKNLKAEGQELQLATSVSLDPRADKVSQDRKARKRGAEHCLLMEALDAHQEADRR